MPRIAINGLGRIGKLVPRAFAQDWPEAEVVPLNDVAAAAADGPLKGRLGYETRPLASSDHVGDTRSAIIDAPAIMVVAGAQVKVHAWHDNEMGHAWRMADIPRMVARSV